MPSLKAHLIDNKEQWLARLKPGNLTYESLNWSDVTVSTLGDTALVTGRDQQKVSYQGNSPMEMDLRAMLVFVRQQGRWKLASHQYSPMVVNVHG
jgi:ketosteroid isomerase-like protein